ncbi:reverse transcriptase [Gossypium australe]|uniref:Reverse transcriptase n=1 Tax=Gossypium australe TaxID=47621 RepID=A0A5B6W880_9ROSI|nr:reverse transcriptase [Gossypium australe]
MDVLRSLFDEDQAERIRTIPLGNTLQPDTMVWQGDKSGEYMAKSGYICRITEEAHLLGNENTILTEQMKNYYAAIWGLKRITNTFLPTLKLRLEALCPLCGEDDESTAHVFRDCNVAKQVLQRLKVRIAPTHENTEWKLWLIETFNFNNTEQRTCLAVSFRPIWHNRNIFYHEGIRQSINDIVSFIKAFINEIKMLDNILESKHKIQEAHWEPPIENQVKVNFDTSFRQPNKKAVSGIIVRNNRGFVMGSCTYPIRNVRDPTTAEAYACLHGVIFAEDLGFEDVIIKGDSLKIVKKLQKKEKKMTDLLSEDS